MSLPPVRIVSVGAAPVPMKELAPPPRVMVPPLLMSMPEVCPSPALPLFVPPVIVTAWATSIVPEAEKSPRKVTAPVPPKTCLPAPRSVLLAELLTLPLVTVPKIWFAELAKSKVAPEATVIAPTYVPAARRPAPPMRRVPASTARLPVKVLTPVRTARPAPDLVRPKFTPLMIPLKVSCVPATLSVLAAPRVTAPDRLLVPVEVASVPPLSVRASVPTTTPRRSSVAPLATVVPAAVVPRPAASVMASVPAETVVAPV